jgi:hypothetical protein
MIYRLLADTVMLAHFAFVLFVVAGGFLVLWRSSLIRWHIPAALWGVVVMVFSLRCPLTPLEWHLRGLSGAQGYEMSFVEQYIFTLLYPAGLTREMQFWLGIGVLAINAVAYGVYFLRLSRSGIADRKTPEVATGSLPSAV